MKNFLLNSGILAIQPFITKIIAYFVIPLYTFALSPIEFGNVEYVLAIGVFFKTFISMSMTSTFWKYIGDSEKWDPKEVIFNIIFISFLLGFIVVAIFITFFFFSNTFSEINRNTITFFISEIISILYMVANLVIRNNFSIRNFLVLTFSYIIIFISSNYLFLDFLNLKENGVFYSYLISSVCVGFGSVLILRKQLIFKVKKDLISDIIKYSFPLMITNIIAILIMFSDRILIKYFRGSHELGLYSFGFKFGALIKSVIIDVFFIIWNPIRWKIYRDNNGNEVFEIISKILFILFPLVGFASVILSDIVGKLLTSDEQYIEGLKIIPLITFGYIFYGLYYYVVMGLLFKEKTVLITKIVLISSVLNIFINILLINLVGYYGAAITAFLTYTFMVIYGSRISNKYYSSGQINYKTIFIIYFFLLSFYIVTEYEILNTYLISVIFSILIIAFNYSEIKKIKKNIQLLKNVLRNVY
jgi:O-antigen/teichoic acid export membrane protein